MREQLRIARVSRKLTQREVAERAELVSRERYNKIEQGKVEPKVSEAHRISRVLGGSIEQFFINKNVLG